MRLFISIQMNKEMRRALMQIQDSMQRQGVRGNFTREENLHLTLAFIGEYPDPYDLKDIIDQIEFDDFAIKLEGLGSFGSLWWAGVSESGKLRALAKQLRRMAGLSAYLNDLNAVRELLHQCLGRDLAAQEVV